jgi:transcription elongation factor GreA
MADDRIPMTREGYEKLKAELAHLNDVKMIEVTKRVAAARDLGDLSENAEYHAAREDQGMLQARIDKLKDTLARAVIVDRNNLPNDTVVFGALVKVKDLDGGDEEEFHLVGPGEEDYNNNKILTTSPRGRALLAHEAAHAPALRAVPQGLRPGAHSKGALTSS